MSYREKAGRGELMRDDDRILAQVVDNYMSRTVGLREYCSRCLVTERWGGSVVLMVVDAAFTSIGLNYFTAVVPAVTKFEEGLVLNGEVQTLRDLRDVPLSRLLPVWKNRRSWQVAGGVASCLADLATMGGLDDRGALRHWAANSSLERWQEDPIGKINGVGITTFQYLRMMGGVDTSMPDKIVRRVVRQILEEAGQDIPVQKDMELIDAIKYMAKLSGYRPVEICWMTWLIQSEGQVVRMEKYQNLLSRI